MAKEKTSTLTTHKGTINTQDIYDVHTQIKQLVISYKDINKRVNEITNRLNDNWVGKGNNEFRTQYYQLICRVDDFGDLLQKMYDLLVKSEASYEDVDDDIRQEIAMSQK